MVVCTLCRIFEFVVLINAERKKDIMNIGREESMNNLEKRIEKLEKLFEHLWIDQCKEITLTKCSLGDVKLGDNCNITLKNCPVGDVISDIEDEESRVDDLECSVDDLECRIKDLLADINEAETRLDTLENDSEC